MITTTLEKAFADVQKLVEKFEKGKEHYMSNTYSESEARQDFIDDFFIALGWDVRHKYQHNPYQQEVKIERSQKQQNESARKRADYAFFVAPNFKDVHFFVEAKKPSVLLHNAPAHYFQTIKYGWNAGCPISVLTDFEEFVIIDCRSKPNIKYALNGKHKSYRYTDYANKEKFAEIYYLFSKEAVTNKSIDAYAKSLPKTSSRVTQKLLFKGGYQAIDDSFLEYIDDIRYDIANAFKRADNSLNSEQLTEATQRTVDRLVFIRFLEDKFIEPINHINEWAASAHPWKAFISDCKALNVKYNGVVFKPLFIDKDNFLGADEKLFGEICNELSSDNSPYDFNYIPIHILGSIYERFLGKVVVATAKRVTIEEKPEVRKAGGVFYTPKYIVDYIVANTVGKLIAGKTPTKIAEMSFADIACGSGSFLIGVYDYLLQYHKDYYAKYPTVAKTDGCVELDGLMTLSIKQKQQILLNNIYGVDIDHQAVEVTQLSLFLKMLEDETLTSTMAQAKQTTLYAKVLPDLTKNIVCGNSLIGTDILQRQLFDMAEERKLNPMDYDTTFPKVFKNGGFDAIVGNPPYVRGSSFDEINKNYFKNLYSSTNDLFSMFVENATNKVKKNSLVGYIIPSLFIKGVNYKPLRNFINNNALSFYCIEKGDNIFANVKMPTAVIILEKGQSNKPVDYFEKNEIKFFNHVEMNLIGEFTTITRGLEIGKDKLSNFGKYICLNGSLIDSYLIKNKNLFISETTFSEYKKNKEIFNSPKLLIRETGDKFYCTIDLENALTNRSIYNLRILNNTISINFIQAILSSKLFKFYFKTFIAPDTKIFPKIRIAQVKEIPIPKLNKKNQPTHDQLITLVDQMLEAKQKLQTLTLERDIDYYEKKCTTLDRQIDNLVYKLYDLTADEIKIIEGN